MTRGIANSITLEWRESYNIFLILKKFYLAKSVRLQVGDLAQAKDIHEVLLIFHLIVHLGKGNLRLKFQRVIEAKPGKNQR